MSRVHNRNNRRQKGDGKARQCNNPPLHFIGDKRCREHCESEQTNYRRAVSKCRCNNRNADADCCDKGASYRVAAAEQADPNGETERRAKHQDYLAKSHLIHLAGRRIAGRRYPTRPVIKCQSSSGPHGLLSRKRILGLRSPGEIAGCPTGGPKRDAARNFSWRRRSVCGCDTLVQDGQSTHPLVSRSAA